jgi:hypothetical protein
MATKDEALKRLGGGRWQTRDGRFSIEPQSGSWVVVDAEQTDDLGLQLVRGPFVSLAAAREAIEAARSGEAPVSPLAARIEEAGERPRPTRERKAPTRRSAQSAEPPTPATAQSPRSTPRARVLAAAAPQGPPARPAPPPEPDWVRGLRPASRTAARALIARLEAAGVERAEAIARAELVDGEPAIARMAVQRSVARASAAGGDRTALVERLLTLLTEGGDDELGARWRLVDGDDRPLGPLRAPD